MAKLVTTLFLKDVFLSKERLLTSRFLKIIFIINNQNFDENHHQLFFQRWKLALIKFSVDKCNKYEITVSINLNKNLYSSLSISRGEEQTLFCVPCADEFLKVQNHNATCGNNTSSCDKLFLQVLDLEH